MMSTKDRLERAARVLSLIQRRRRETNDLGLGAGIERFVMHRELNELEAEILDNPGALESLLVRRNGQ